MIVQIDFLNKLKDFGLNSYESKLWTALLSRGVSTAGELSDIANVPRSRSYDVLESLEKKGFIIMKLGKPIKYIAVPPNEVLERVKKKIKDNSERELKTIEQLKVGEIINELNLLHTQGIELVEPVDLSGSLKGRDNLYNHLETMIKGAQKSITIMTTTQGLLRKLEILKYTLLKAKQRGVKIRVAAPITKDILSQIKDFSKIAEIKNTNIKARFCLVDGDKIVFMLLDDADLDPNYDVGIWAETKPFLSGIKALFESNWSNMKPVSQVKV